MKDGKESKESTIRNGRFAKLRPIHVENVGAFGTESDKITG